MLAKTALTFATVFASAALTVSARPFTKYPVGSPGEVTAHAEQPVAETGAQKSPAVVQNPREPATHQPQPDQQMESHPGQQEGSHPAEQAHLSPQPNPRHQDDLQHATELTEAQHPIAEDGAHDTESDDETTGVHTVGQETVAPQQITEQQVGPRPAAEPMAEHHPESESDDEGDGEETEVESRQLPRAHGVRPTHMGPPGVQPPLMEAHAVQPVQVTTVSQPELSAGPHPATPPVEAHQPMTEQDAESDDESDGEETPNESHRRQQRAHGVRRPQMEAHGMQPTQMEAHGMQSTQMDAHTVEAAQLTTITQPEQAADPHHSKSSTGSQQQEAETNIESDHNPGDDHPTHVENVQPPQAHASEPTRRDVHGSASTQVTTIGQPVQPVGSHHANPRML